MIRFFSKTFFIFLFMLLLYPGISFSQSRNDYITEVIWDDEGTETLNYQNVLIKGRLNINRDIISRIVKYSFNYGFPGDFSAGNVNYNHWNQDSRIYNSYQDLSGANKDEFNYNIYNLWPSSFYYVVLHEWNMEQNHSRSLLNPMIFRTGPITDINLNVISEPNGSIRLMFSSNAMRNSYRRDHSIVSGLPVTFYFLEEDHSGQNIDIDNPPKIAFSVTATLARDGTADVRIPFGILDPDTTYYLKMINEQPGAGGLSLRDEDIPILINQLIEEEEDDDDTTTPPRRTPPTFQTDEDFSQGLVPCDETTVTCSFEKLLVMVNRVISFLIFIIGIPLVALTFAYAGFLLVTSGGNPSKKDAAKSAVGSAVIGFILLLSAWLIVKTILIVFGYSGPLLGILGA